MPELPEVETVVRDLRSQLPGLSVTSVDILWPRTIAVPTAEGFAAGLLESTILDVRRRGKYILMPLSTGETWLTHLRMTGRLRVEKPAAPACSESHVRVRVGLSNGGCLVFNDQRKFGRMWVVPDPQSVVGKLGPEPLEDVFTSELFASLLGGRRVSIKPLLLRQDLIAGLGNIYVDESLHRAGIHPLRHANSLTAPEILRLHRAIRDVLGSAIDARGTTIRDYEPPLSASGRFQEQLAVYAHTGEPCANCGLPIEYIRVGQRGTHFCPACQPAQDGD
jgi:formamidopyrimidine-DNA glycosylase